MNKITKLKNTFLSDANKFNDYSLKYANCLVSRAKFNEVNFTLVCLK